ncbi:MAG TPA: hypothetical protein VFC00_39775, partial [Micromonosporaceae bacterium]|nr:hypothetical protein [Micromonosporaceae bacterium]
MGERNDPVVPARADQTVAGPGAGRGYAEQERAVVGRQRAQVRQLRRRHRLAEHAAVRAPTQWSP